MALTNSPLFIGYGKPGFDHHFNGMIDEIMIFRKALSENEITSLSQMVKQNVVPQFGIKAMNKSSLEVWDIEEVYFLKTEKAKRSESVRVYRLE